MALIVEDGTGLANAESYISVADIDTYAAAYAADATAWLALDLNGKEKQARRAATYLVHTFGQRFKGKKKTSAQALDFPRLGIYDAHLEAIGDDSIPTALARANAEVAIAGAANPTLPLGGPSAPTLTSGPPVLETEKQVGPLSTRTVYSGGGSQQPTSLVAAGAASGVYPIVQAMLAELLEPAGRVYRT